MTDGLAAVVRRPKACISFLNVIRGELRDGKSHHFWLGRNRGSH